MPQQRDGSPCSHALRPPSACTCTAYLLLKLRDLLPLVRHRSLPALLLVRKPAASLGAGPCLGLPLLLQHRASGRMLGIQGTAYVQEHWLSIRVREKAFRCTMVHCHTASAGCACLVAAKSQKPAS